MLFRDEWFLLALGFAILFVQVAARTYLPQLTKAYSDALFVACYSTFCYKPELIPCRLCADTFGNAFLTDSFECPFTPLEDGSCPIFTVGVLKNPTALDEVLKNRTACSDSNCSPDLSLFKNEQCFCSGENSDQPISVRSAFHELMLFTFQIPLTPCVTVPRLVSDLRISAAL